MYKKIFALLLTVGCINVSFADTPNNSSALFTNPNQIGIDQLASAQQRINFLEHKDRMSKSSIGASFATGSIVAGGMAAMCAGFITDKEQKGQVLNGIAVLTVIGMVTGGTVMAFADATNTPTEEERKEAQELQSYILEKQSK